MIFLAHCKDQVGIVASISSFFASQNLNITSLEEHAEQGQFFCRIEAEGTEDFEGFQSAFLPVSERLQMKFWIFHESQKTNIVLFCSASLPCPMEIISQMLSGTLAVNIMGIISNFETIEPIAKKLGIPFFYTPTNEKNYEQAQFEILNTLNPELICLGRYMKILSADFLANWHKPIINIHHSFLPSFVGGKPYEMAFERGVKLIGATAHFATKDLDEGPIIAQAVLSIGHASSVEEMKSAGSQIEKSVFAEAIQKFSERKILEFQGRTIVFR